MSIAEHRTTILLVEDNPRDELLTCRELERHNLANHIVVAHDGAEAVELLYGENGLATNGAEDMPAAVMLDLKLPKLNGHQVLERIRADERTKTLPVVILTSSDLESDIIKGYENGANGYVCKPVDFEEFRATIKKLGLFWLLTNTPPPMS